GERLGDAEDIREVLRPDAGSDGGGSRDAVARGSVWIDAVVNAEVGPLGPFEQDALPAFQRGIQPGRRVGHEGSESLAVGLVFPFNFSSRPSRILWYGITTCARSLFRRFVMAWPRARVSSISFRSCAGSMTTPFPITFIVRFRRTPDGSKWNAYRSFPTWTVWPAFAPPWNRATTSA